jgi:hypothetical protein
MSAIELRTSVLLTLQVALLGRITPNLRAVTCGWSSGSVVVRFIYHGNPDKDADESVSEVETDLVAAMPEKTVKTEICRLDAPRKLRTSLLEAWVYRRKE